MSFYTSGQDKADTSSGIGMAQQRRGSRRLRISSGSVFSRPNFWKLNNISEEKHGIVYQARNTTGEIVALKKMRMERQKDGIPVSELQKMTILLGLENES